MSSKYSVSPLKSKKLGKTTRVNGGGCRLARWTRDRGCWNPSSSDSSLGSMDRQGTIVSGAKYPEWGIRQRESRTRLVVDESSFPIDG